MSEQWPPRATVAAQLQAALETLRQARTEYMRLTEQWLEAKQRLTLAEDLALLGGTIDGKNEAVREAQLRQATAAHREPWTRLELQRFVATTQVTMAEEAWSTAKALARLLVGGEG